MYTFSSYPAIQFTVFRTLFGVYLAYYFFALLPYSKEMFSSEGLVPDKTGTLLYGYFPGIFSFFDSPSIVTWSLVAFGVASLLIASGFARRPLSVFVWFGLASMLTRNPFIEDPSLAFMGWLLLMMALIPTGEPYALSTYLSSKRRFWQMPLAVYVSTWLLVGFTYTVSGIDRFSAPSWHNGTAMAYLYNLFITRDWFFVEVLRLQPVWLIQAQTWLVVFIFSFTLPALLFFWTRFLWWILLVSMFVFVGLVFELDQVVLGILLLYLFLFDTRWFLSGREYIKRLISRLVELT